MSHALKIHRVSLGATPVTLQPTPIPPAPAPIGPKDSLPVSEWTNLVQNFQAEPAAARPAVAAVSTLLPGAPGFNLAPSSNS